MSWKRAVALWAAIFLGFILLLFLASLIGELFTLGAPQ